MSLTLKYSYASVFAPYIEGLILQKKSCGFIYDYEAYILKKFDDLCVSHGYTEALITRELAMEWAKQRDSESINYRNQRVSFLRQLSLYMVSLGINSYIPRQQPSRAVSVPHIPDAGELRALFDVIYTQCSQKRCGNIFPIGYKVLYRQSKGDKDRLVYMADDLTELCRKYDETVSLYRPDRTWFFPGRDKGKPLHKTGICHKFKQFWEMTEHSKNCEKSPTVHSLRHAYVVDRMNQWMSDGVSLEAMMPYLNRYLGHSGINDTMYYYHQVREAFQIVRQKDYLSGQIIPEVTAYEG